MAAMQDQVDTIRSICIGISAHQKLELLSTLVKLLGYESLAVFGDCFDEVGAYHHAASHSGTPCYDHNTLHAAFHAVLHNPKYDGPHAV